MKPSQRFVNKQDRRRLRQAIDAARRSWSTYGPYLDWLTTQLDAASGCEPAEVPDDVVTMNSRVEVQDLRTGEKQTLTLVYPGQQAGEATGVSVFEPTGLALLGSRIGDVLGWSEPDRWRTARVGRLCYQPEAAGDLDL